MTTEPSTVAQAAQPAVSPTAQSAAPAPTTVEYRLGVARAGLEAALCLAQRCLNNRPTSTDPLIVAQRDLLTKVLAIVSQ